ncbi:Uu.00g141570.m01.CDS01 [Anthostomella pinea]|uniref:non-specific serine/threonine protein kinase n=1 Tax=Anthostomella pinea TaxID=933095 RepID=A0AAI8VQ94_9PEZI|nr:Uu.00g141570.m01.CDS01 [Anthostomella pinea]
MRKAWRAVKIYTADQSSDDCADAMVAGLFRSKGGESDLKLQASCRSITVPLDTFCRDSPNGRHFCSVQPVLGPRLSDWRSEIGTDSARVNDLCRQMVEGLRDLHQMGICHNDFRRQNILMKLQPGCLNDISEEDMRHSPR